MTMPTRTAELPLAGLEMAVRNVTRAEAEEGAADDAPAARFELVFTTGAPVRRYDYLNGRYYLEQLEVTGDAINLDRLQRGAPLLDSHWGYTLSGQIGVCDQPTITNGAGVCQAQLSRRAEVRGIVQDLEDRVIRNVSVGYSREAIEMIAPASEQGMWVYRVTRWTPMEVSLVPIPADMDSQVRAEGGQLRDGQGRELRSFPCRMTETRTQPNTEPSSPTPAAGPSAEAQTRNHPESTTMPQAASQQAPGGGNAAAEPQTRSDAAAVETARVEGQRLERERQATIRTAVQAARGTLGAEADALATRLIDAGTGIDAARAEIINALVERSNATATRAPAAVQTQRDQVDTVRASMEDALHLRVNPTRTTVADRTIDVAAARSYRGMRLVDLARRSIAASGGNADGLSQREIALAALNLDRDAQLRAGMHGSSDFPNVLASTVNRSLRAAYQLAPRSFTGWARRSTAPDFRQKAVTQLSELSRFKKVNESGEYKFLTFGDSAEKYSLSKYGGIIAISWEAIVNDDMSAFDRLPTMIAEEAAGTEGDIVYGILQTNGNLSDGKPLFGADHGNLAAASAINVASLSTGRAAMRKQTGPQGRVLNLAPDFLIVGPDKELEANQFTSVQYVAAKGVDINPAFNTSLEVVVEHRVPGNAWYLSASPARVDTIEYAYLEGEEGLFTERKEGFDVDGLLIKARHVFAAAAIDHRGMYRNPGA
jgi:hypothetical protein